MLERGFNSIGLGAPTMTTMPMPQLKVRSISRLDRAAASLQPSEIPAAGANAPRSISAREAGGQHARHVLGQAAAGDMGERLDRRGLANRFKQRRT